MSRSHSRELSINRLTHPLPPLPFSLSEIPSSQPKESQLPPYRDVEPTPNTTHPELQSQPQLPPPPGYQPMHDYLRSHRLLHPNPPSYTSPPHSRTQSYTDTPPPPFIITIDPPPPSYDEVYIQHQQYMERLIREFDENGSPSERSEEIFKWFVAMVLIGLTVCAVGVAFDWGGLRCGRIGGRC